MQRLRDCIVLAVLLLLSLTPVALHMGKAVYRTERGSERSRMETSSTGEEVLHDGQSRNEKSRSELLEEADAEAGHQVFARDPGMSDAEHCLASHALKAIGEKVEEGELPELASAWGSFSEAIQQWNHHCKSTAANRGTIDQGQARAVTEAYRKLLQLALQVAQRHGSHLHLIMPDWYKTIWENYEAAIKPPVLERVSQTVKETIETVRETAVTVWELVKETASSVWGWIKAAFRKVVQARKNFLGLTYSLVADLNLA